MSIALLAWFGFLKAHLHKISRISHLIPAAVAVIVGLSGCVHPITYLSKEPVSLAYVGSISFGQPTISGDQLVVPLALVPTREWVLNSATSPYGIAARAIDNQIEFTVLRALLPGKQMIWEIRTRKVVDGEYTMIYVDPDGSKHPVGKIKVGK